MGTLILLLALASGREAPEPVDVRAEICEHNSLYDGEGRLTFRQLIWWSHSECSERFTVDDWRLDNDGRYVPCKTRHGWQSLFIDRDGVFRRVRTRSAFRSWTMHDPELENRIVLPTDERRGLK